MGLDGGRKLLCCRRLSLVQQALDGEVSEVSVTCVIGLQWGDEAKGKLVDLLTDEHESSSAIKAAATPATPSSPAARPTSSRSFPAASLSPQVQCVVTGGVVLNPASILQEIDGLTARGIKVGSNLMLSDRAHVIFPWHIAEDAILDKSCSSGENIGTTMRGIGPCYRDKVARSFAVRLGDMYRDRFRGQAGVHRRGQERHGRRRWPTRKPFDADGDRTANTLATPSGCRPYVGDTTAYLLDAVEAGKRMLLEGAQGALLDVDHGTFPFVTSSNSSGVGVSSGSGVPGRWITKVIGVVKAYSTRVGGGPFPDRTGQRHGPAHSRPGQRIRHGHPAPAALRLVRRRGRSLYGAAERRRCVGRDVARRAERTAGAQDLHGLRDRRPAGRRIFPATSTTCGVPMPVYETCPAGSRTLPRCARWPTCRGRPGTTWPG